MSRSTSSATSLLATSRVCSLCATADTAPCRLSSSAAPLFVCNIRSHSAIRSSNPRCRCACVLAISSKSTSVYSESLSPSSSSSGSAAILLSSCRCGLPSSSPLSAYARAWSMRRRPREAGFLPREPDSCRVAACSTRRLPRPPGEPSRDGRSALGGLADLPAASGSNAASSDDLDSVHSAAPPLLPRPLLEEDRHGSSSDSSSEVTVAAADGSGSGSGSGHARRGCQRYTCAATLASRHFSRCACAPARMAATSTRGVLGREMGSERTDAIAFAFRDGGCQDATSRNHSRRHWDGSSAPPC